MGCEAYKDESEMEGDHQCPTHKAPCLQRQEENYFFALSNYQQQIQVPCSHSRPVAWSVCFSRGGSISETGQGSTCEESCLLE